MSVQEKKKSICCYCGVGCGVLLSTDLNGTLTVEGDPDHPVNRGMLCSKGINLAYTVNDRQDRLLYPQIRDTKGGELRRATWDEALERVAGELTSLIAEYGPDSVAMYTSGQCLTEEYYLSNKLMKGFIGSNNIDTNSRLCMSSAVAAYKMAFGEDIVPTDYTDIELADCIFVIGSNPAWCHPIIWRRVEAAKARNPDLVIIVVDPRRTVSCELADIHLQLIPGTDIVLNHAIGRLLIENELIDAAFIREHSTGFDAYRKLVGLTSLEESALICGLKPEEIVQVASLIGKSNTFLSFWAMGMNQSAMGINKNLSLLNLHIITGQLGRAGAGPFSLTGQPNAMGGREAGGLANILPAHRNLNNPQHRLEVQNFWGGKPIGSTPGLTATEIFTALADDRLKAVWIVNTNPMVSLPNVHLGEKAMKNARFVVVQDISQDCSSLAYADVVFPAAAWAEKTGTMTNSERRIALLEKACDPPGEALPDTEIICRVARAMGFAGFDFATSAEIYDEHCRLTTGTHIDITGLSHARLKKEGSVLWPLFPNVVGADSAPAASLALTAALQARGSQHSASLLSSVGSRTSVGSPTLAGREPAGQLPALYPARPYRMFADHQFYTPTGKANIYAVSAANESELTDASFPLVLTSGRVRDQWQTMTKTGKVNKLKRHAPECYLEINPVDAAALLIADNTLVAVSSRRGEVRVKARITDTIRQGVVFIPMHWGKILGSDLNRANNLTSDRVDPVSMEPDYKYCAVQVLPYHKPVERIVLIGAGAATTSFVRVYRKLNAEDELIVFSKEEDAFYNRIMLSEYISGKQEWSSLQKLTPAELADLNVTLITGREMLLIDKTNKLIVDSAGVTTSYDRLIIATGSRANELVLPVAGVKTNGDRSTDAETNLPEATLPDTGLTETARPAGVFTLRNRSDAESLRTRLTPGSRIVIAGGGLLGIELAAALLEMKFTVSVIQRSPRMMQAQLDLYASQLLHDELSSRGCGTYYDDEITGYLHDGLSGQSVLTGVILSTGKHLYCDTVIVATGTTPTIELGLNTGLNCGKGITVNAAMQTSDDSIFAIGEVAEFAGRLAGTTAAAGEQAGIAARFISGDIAAQYGGSLVVNRLKMPGFQLCSLGDLNATGEELTFKNTLAGTYKKCVISGGRLLSAILVGDLSEVIAFSQLIGEKTELTETQLELIRAGIQTPALKGAIVCSCNQIGAGSINQLLDGCETDLETICQRSGAGTGCGSCKPEISRMIKAAASRGVVGLKGNVATDTGIALPVDLTLPDKLTSIEAATSGIIAGTDSPDNRELV